MKHFYHDSLFTKDLSVLDRAVEWGKYQILDDKGNVLIVDNVRLRITSFLINKLSKISNLLELREQKHPTPQSWHWPLQITNVHTADLFTGWNDTK